MDRSTDRVGTVIHQCGRSLIDRRLLLQKSSSCGHRQLARRNYSCSWQSPCRRKKRIRRIRNDVVMTWDFNSLLARVNRTLKKRNRWTKVIWSTCLTSRSVRREFRVQRRAILGDCRQFHRSHSPGPTTFGERSRPILGCRHRHQHCQLSGLRSRANLHWPHERFHLQTTRVRLSRAGFRMFHRWQARFLFFPQSQRATIWTERGRWSPPSRGTTRNHSKCLTRGIQRVWRNQSHWIHGRQSWRINQAV